MWGSVRCFVCVRDAGDVWLNPAFRESHALQDVHFLLLGHLFGLGYRRIERRVDAADTEARTHLPAAGFHLEGVLRKHMIVKVRLAGFCLVDGAAFCLQHPFAAHV